jgi:hypothetical protein
VRLFLDDQVAAALPLLEAGFAGREAALLLILRMKDSALWPWDNSVIERGNSQSP